MQKNVIESYRDLPRNVFKKRRNLIVGENGLLFDEPNLIVAKLLVSIC